MRRAALWLAPVLGVAIVVLGRAGALGSLTPAAATVLGVAVLMAIWWMTEAAPIVATSLLPAVLFPCLDVGTARTVSASYADPLILLMMGGFFLSVAIERSELHRRIALHVLRVVGTRPDRLVLGFLVATAFISMWISNTATALMMLPIALAVLRRLEERAPDDPRLRPVAIALLLAVAYASSIGGLGTPIGTGPNLIFLGQYRAAFPDAEPITFLGWMKRAVPIVVVLLGAAWLILTRLANRVDPTFRPDDRGLLDEDLRALGPMTSYERRMSLAFVVIAGLWIFRQPMELGAVSIGGWAPWLGMGARVDDSTVALAVVVLLFLLPSGLPPTPDGESPSLLEWRHAIKIPWDILILFGGGLALADAFERSGLSLWIGNQIGGLGTLPTWLLVGTVCLAATLLTEIASNIALTTILMPLLAAVSKRYDIPPLTLMLPAAMGASCGFMMPVGTPPNAIVFASGHLRMRDMVRAGAMLDLVGVVVLTVGLLVLG